MNLKINVVSNYFGQIFVAFLGFAFVPVYIKYLGIEAYGLIGFYATLQASLSMLDMGMSSAIGRDISIYTAGNMSSKLVRDLLRSVEVVMLIIGASTAFIVGMSASWIASSWLKVEILPAQTVSNAIAAMGVVVGIRLVENVYRSVVIALQRQAAFNMINVLISILRWGGAALIVSKISQEITIFFLWNALVSILSIILLSNYTYLLLPNDGVSGKFSLSALNKIRKFASGMFGINILALVLTQVDKVLLSKLLNLADYGHYMLASSVAVALFMLVGPISQAFYPKFCEDHSRDNVESLSINFHLSAQLVSVVVGSAAIILALNSEVILYLWTNSQDLSREVSPLMQLLLFGNLLNSLLWIPYQMQLAHGWTRLGVQANAIAVIVLVPLLVVMVSMLGAIGAAIVWIILNVGYLFVSVQIMYRRILPNEKWNWYKYDIVIPIFGSVSGALAIYLVFQPQSVNMPNQILTIILEAILAICFSACLSSKIRPHVMVEISKLKFLMNKND